MPFGDKDTLAAHFNNENFITEIDLDKFTEIANQITDLIFQKTKVPVPVSAASAPGILRMIWADIISFEIIPYQKGITDEEKTRRTTKFKTAFTLLNEIANGDIELTDSGGTPLVDTEDDSIVVTSNLGKRIDLIP